MSTKRTERAAQMRDNRNTAILEAAIAEADEKGFAGVRQSAVAKRAGVAKGGVINAFGTMEALKSAIMEEAVARFMPKIVAAGLALDHPIARNAPPDLRAAAAAAIS
jgi:TetR/AcrR family transcriptional regulator of autoinduction and epiphytic fitness